MGRPRQAWLAPLAGALLLLVGARPTLAQTASAMAGVIDAPRANAVVSAGSLQVAGWFVDRTAQGWAGADDVEVVLGSLDGGGRPLAHALFAQSRPDVAGSMGNPFWSQSGWS